MRRRTWMTMWRKKNQTSTVPSHFWYCCLRSSTSLPKSMATGCGTATMALGEVKQAAKGDRESITSSWCSQGQWKCRCSCGTIAASLLTARITKQSMVMMANPIRTRTAMHDGGGILLGLMPGFYLHFWCRFLTLSPWANGVWHWFRYFHNEFLSFSLSDKLAWSPKLPGFTGSLDSLYLLSWHSSIKLKIDQKVGASLLESEFDWLSQIPYGEAWVIFSTDWLLNESMTIAFQIDLSVQFVQVPCFQRWTF